LSDRPFYAALPNLISLARLLAVPLAVWLIVSDRLGVAFWLFVAAGISDALDGFLAKHLDLRSELGAYLDPLADKALLTSVYVTLGYEGHMASWLVILVVFRDVLIIGGAILYQTLTGALRMQPLLISKLNTAAQIALAAVVLAQSGLGVDYGIDTLLVPVVAATTLASGGAYLVVWGWRALHMQGRS
jgi:cardiolipin synthase (CMP-forming)